ncbi:hypothetical protein QBC46DRAFT_439856 [Diplogelasinospora grovesii]|uniref:Uncharacterized protein n=1 Tax=Diplogelasinospora grovesii TaxID=303347 RepID=A0AAN6N6G2_9PEZI|nr:hypothetical protein QBC46DRAFT_439856 [Diplogelasinospora grovesii]
MDPEASPVLRPQDETGNSFVRDRFHHQIHQHGNELVSFVAEELRGTPPGMSITLTHLEWASQVNWIWLVGCADDATEQAVLRFFQTDAGKRALVSEGPDPIEFKLGVAALRLPVSQAEDLVLPAHLTAAASPLQGDKDVKILSKSQPYPICVSTGTSGWLQVPPHLQLSQVLSLRLKEETQPDTEDLRSWLVDIDASTAYGHVAAFVGAQGVLVTPLTGHV